MLSVTLGRDPSEPLRILCLGAHGDDIEIGCGGTLLRLLRDRPGSSVRWVVFSADDVREAEVRASATDFLAGADAFDVTVHRFRENYFPHVGAEVKDAVAQLVSAEAPDIVFSHRRDDEHQDHRAIAGFTWNTFRDHLIAEYEIPKYEGDLGHPNAYVALDSKLADHKVELLMRHYGSQHDKRWFRPETFRGLMAVRGVECNASWAEAFHIRKISF